MPHVWNEQYRALYDRTYRVLFDAGFDEKLANEMATQRALAATQRRQREQNALDTRSGARAPFATRVKTLCFAANFSLAGGEGGIRTPDTLASMPHFECGAFNHSATSPEPKSGLKRLRTDGRYVTKGAKTDKGYTSYIEQRSINPVTARQADV